MRLTEAQQERYARHLLLDHLGGEGQERLLSSCVRVRGTGQAVRWAARYLAASGVGTLVLEDEAAAAECRELSPDVRVLNPLDPNVDLYRGLDVHLDLDLDLPPRAARRQPPAERGAMAALAALRDLVRP
jgi:hypothetical protein